MKRTAAFIFIASVLISLAGCTFTFTSGGVSISGNCTEEGCNYSENRDCGSFSELDASGPFNVHFIQSDEWKVLVEGDEASVSKIVTEVRNGRLGISLLPGRYQNLILKVTVWSPDIRLIHVSGSGDLLSTTGISTSGHLDLSTSGSGDIRMDCIHAGDLDIRSAGSGDIMVERISSGNVVVSTSGSGDVRIDILESDGDVKFQSAGSGDAFIGKAGITGELNVRTLGSGDIRVNGRCASVTAKSSGSGDISGNLEYGNIRTGTAGSGEIRL